ncbi:MAG: transposase, partial [Burkholderiales bacterium]|nr:transposase [Burkholderiales bacterium]
MAARDIIARLGCWAGYEVSATREEQRGGCRWCVVELAAKGGVSRCCSGCGRPTYSVHDAQERRIRDLPIFEVPVELVLPRLRVRCPACGPKLEALDWLDPYARVTRRLG